MALEGSAADRLGGSLPTDALAAENARLVARVRELEHRLRRERARNAGLERGVTALSARRPAVR